MDLKASCRNFIDSLKAGNYSSSMFEYATISMLLYAIEERAAFLDKVAELAQTGMPEDNLQETVGDMVLELLGQTK